MEKPRTVILLNKNARQLRKRRQKILDIINAQRANIDVRLLHPRNINNELRELLHDRPQKIIVGGGDGTIVSAANLLAKTQTALGILPLGTTNSFARSLGLPLDITEAAEVALNGRIDTCNLGSVNGHSFVGVAAIGLSETVASSINDTTKKRFGRFAYAFVGAWHFLRKSPFDVHIKTDKKDYSFRSRQVVVSNARFHGSLPVMQDASIHQDALAIISFGKSGSKFEHARNLWRFVRGTHSQSHEAVAFKATQATITTSPVKRVEIDGEVRDKTPIDVRLEEDALKVVVV